MTTTPPTRDLAADLAVWHAGMRARAERRSAKSGARTSHLLRAEGLAGKVCWEAFEEAATRARAAEAEVERLASAIRDHRDQRGDDRCWLDDGTLYGVLPEGYTPPERDTLVQLEMCEKFIRSRCQPMTEYVSPQREIERLEAEVQRLRAIIDGMAARIAGQSELLSRRAEG